MRDVEYQRNEDRKDQVARKVAGKNRDGNKNFHRICEIAREDALERRDEYGNSFNKKSDGVEKRGHCGLVGEHPGIDDSHGNANECRCRADEICRQRAAVFVVKIILGEGFKAVFCYVI